MTSLWGTIPPGGYFLVKLASNGSDFTAVSSNATNPARNSATPLQLCTCQ